MNRPTPEAYQLLHEGSLALARMEANGIRIDTEYLDSAIEKLSRKISKLQTKLREDKVFGIWRREWGEKTNLGSLSQLARILFEVMEYPCSSFTETCPHCGAKSSDERQPKCTQCGGRKKPKADEEALQKIDHPFVKDFLKLRKYLQDKNTFLGSIQKQVVDGYLRPFFSLGAKEDDEGGARSYRSSSSDPNFQNLPIRDPVRGEMIRKCFIPRDGHLLVEVDFKGIEVCVSGCYHQDPVFLEYIRNPKKDMHRDMAAQCFLLKPREINKVSRYCAKNMFVFPQFYGSFYVDCARSLWEALDRMKLVVGDTDKPLKQHLKEKGITELGKCDPEFRPEPGTFEYHIKEVEDDFWNNRFRVYTQWKRKRWEEYLRDGGFRMLTGFWVEGLYSRNQILNYPIQGSAFHCLLWTLIQLQKAIDKRGMKTKLMGQIHDSIIADVPEDEVQRYLNLVKKITSVRLPRHWKWIIVPMTVEVEVATTNWFEKKAWIQRGGVWGPEKQEPRNDYNVDVNRPKSQYAKRR